MIDKQQQQQKYLQAFSIDHNGTFGYITYTAIVKITRK